ncbi:phage shock protein A (IM30), suppresses sigma54-dependent transcription [Desulfosporosinus acidiphilus SJ4]|uniref:Phage shock protein A (IM30), suppresses sigma54-dependent transcription n=1 Tax=Desulfosporosinus acidiphilus (strain DSM 22704 / JCM 16185 / SJ4) TaxID=646529 RepID=I4DAG0_DESAJ|nr:PspA/IM30 family protein [Desulfosporosinus acidiphilus]AFM42784.1 phage shock protein A (IM30), suppresses sigma54-dependent transcription [Desulfosporosinus acidiphilus SJ4]
MGIFVRLKQLFEAKVDKSLDRAEDPGEMLDFSLRKMEDALQRIVQNTVQLTTSKKRVEMQRDEQIQMATNYQKHAEKALALGQEDLAREALNRKAEAEERIQELENQLSEMDHQLTATINNQEELKHKISNFRSKKEELKAVYNASQVQLKVKEMMTSVGSEADEVGKTIERAESKIYDMQARVKAIDELTEQGVISEAFDSKTDDMERRFRKLSKDSKVEEELTLLRKKLASNN